MKKNINLYTQYLKENERKQQLPWQKITLTSLSISLLMVFLVFAAYNIKNVNLVKEKKELLSFIESKENIKIYQSAKENQVELEEQLELHNKIYGVNQILREKRQFNPGLFDQIELSEPLGLRSRNLKFCNGTALIDYDSVNLDGPSVFAKNLNQKILIKDVKYQGFKKENIFSTVDEANSDFNFFNQDYEVFQSQEEFVYRGQLEIILEGGY